MHGTLQLLLPEYVPCERGDKSRVVSAFAHATKRTFTALTPAGFDCAPLRFALAHLRPLFCDPTYKTLPVLAFSDASIFAYLFHACLAAADPAPDGIALATHTRALAGEAAPQAGE